MHVACAGTDGELRYSINCQLVYSSSFPRQPLTIIGVAYSFQGTGAIKATSLQAAGKIVFKPYKL